MQESVLTCIWFLVYYVKRNEQFDMNSQSLDSLQWRDSPYTGSSRCSQCSVHFWHSRIHLQQRMPSSKTGQSEIFASNTLYGGMALEMAALGNAYHVKRCSHGRKATLWSLHGWYGYHTIDSRDRSQQFGPEASDRPRFTQLSERPLQPFENLWRHFADLVDSWVACWRAFERICYIHLRL